MKRFCFHTQLTLTELRWEEPQAGWACTSGWCFPQPHCLKSVIKLHHKVPGPSNSRHKYLSHFDFKTLKGRKCKTSVNLHLHLKTNLCSTWIWETESEFRWNRLQSIPKSSTSKFLLPGLCKQMVAARTPSRVPDITSLCPGYIKGWLTLSSWKSFTLGRVKSIVPCTKLPFHHHSQLTSLQGLCFQHSTAQLDLPCPFLRLKS